MAARKQGKPVRVAAAAPRSAPPVTVIPGVDGLVARVGGPRPTLDELFPGEDNYKLREEITQLGIWRAPKTDVRVMLRPRSDGKQEVMMMEDVRRASATVPRDPGQITDILANFTDFQFLVPRDKTVELRQFQAIYLTDGLVNTSVNKLSALLSSGGQFKVRTAKKGKKQKAREELEAILDEVNRSVNNAPADGVVTGARGLKQVTQQAVRQCLIDGDWFGRTVWINHQVRTLGSFSLPMVIQSLATADMLPITELNTSGIEAWYWKPDTSLLQQLQNPKDPIVRDLLKRYVDSKTLSALKKDGQVFLDQSLLMHVRHRGAGNSPYGESFIRPALYGIAYKRAVENLDLVVIQSIISRITLVMVGSSDPKSPYSDPAVARQRQASMQSLFDSPDPNMTIIWQGDDVKIVDIGAHSTVLDLDGRHNIGDRMKKESLGIPDALITGSTTDGKSAGMVSLVSAGASLSEIQSSFEQVYTTLGQRVAEENGYQDADIVYEFDNSMMIDRVEERNQARNDFLTGGMSLRSFIAARGQDPDAEFRQACVEKGLDPDVALWKDAFAPPTGLPGQGAPGDGVPAGPPGQQGRNPGAGRTPDATKGRPSKAPKETKKLTPNK